MGESIKFIGGNEKIRLLRKQLRLTQGDFQNPHFTRGYLGLLENGRRNITYQASKYIASKLMEKAKEQGINLSLDDDYFSRSIERDAEIYCEEKLKEKMSLEELDELIEISEEYNLDFVKCKLCTSQGEIFFDDNNFIEAYKKYFYALDLLRNNTENSETCYILNRIGLCKYNLLQYKEALVYLEKVISNASANDDNEALMSGYYNSALCYKALGKFDKVIELTDKFVEICDIKDDFSGYVYALSLKANCYKDMEKQDDAIDIYIKLIDIIKEEDDKSKKLLGYIYNNLGNLEFKRNNFAKALEYYNKSQFIRTEWDKENISHTLIEKADIYVSKELYDEALMIVNLGIEKAKEFNDYKYIINGYKELEKIYVAMGMNDKLEEITKIIIGILKNREEKSACIEYYLKLQKLYFSTNNYDGAYKCTDMIQNLLK